MVASKEGHGLGAAVVRVGVRDAALPTVSNDDMLSSAKGALGRSLKSQAVADRHVESLIASTIEIEAIKARIAALESTGRVLKDRLKERAKRREDPKCLQGIDHTILVGNNKTAVISLTGLRSHASLEKLFIFLDEDGAAQNLTFYDGGRELSVKNDGSRVAQRKKTFRGINGLFFVLFILRTSTPVAVTSALFGRNQTTEGRVFSTWLNFLARSFRPLVRLPLLAEVTATAPLNFKRSELSEVVCVLDATELEVERSWNKDAGYALYSPYRGKPTGKVLVATTPGGMICYISGAYPGRLSDAEVVKESGLIDDLVKRGFDSGKYKVMADRGFNSIAPLLLRHRILFVAPPWKRRGEPQFTETDANLTQEVANRRIHVERAIGAMKKWRILDTKFSTKQFDQMEMCCLVVGALVNLLKQPFSSER
eukprot:jgi/Undpi1/12882/HiC_scaffold_7.g02548.m1